MFRMTRATSYRTPKVLCTGGRDSQERPTVSPSNWEDLDRIRDVRLSSLQSPWIQDIGLVEICVHHLDDEECHRTRAETDRARGLAKVKCPVCDDVIITHKELAKHCLQVHPEDGVESRPQDYSAIKE
ncbi:unnamed protein product [Nippostrongylus brasiliensis]|uniref:C2H2-type domain-containing protein n=1 Tax=Nippostrongylus brasiliensis TaxID=27835 RepID=A0A0N4XGE3_NIPBR|nr:unnamed protein product [Nippostrongylus brasiliensis]